MDNKYLYLCDGCACERQCAKTMTADEWKKYTCHHMDGIKFEPYEMTNKEAEETLQGIAGLLYMLVAGGAFKEFDSDNPILHMVNKYPYAVSKAIEAMRCMDNRLDIEKEDGKS